MVIGAPLCNHLKSSDGAEDGKGVVGMLFDHGHFRVRQSRRFFQDRVRDDKLAKIMEQSRYFQQFHLGFRHTYHLGEKHGTLGYARGMSSGKGRFEIDNHPEQSGEDCDVVDVDFNCLKWTIV